MQYLHNQSFANKTVCTNALFYTIVTQRHASPFTELPHIAVTTTMVKIAVSHLLHFLLYRMIVQYRKGIQY